VAMLMSTTPPTTPNHHYLYSCYYGRVHNDTTHHGNDITNNTAMTRHTMDSTAHIPCLARNARQRGDILFSSNQSTRRDCPSSRPFACLLLYKVCSLFYFVLPIVIVFIGFLMRHKGFSHNHHPLPHSKREMEGVISLLTHQHPLPCSKCETEGTVCPPTSPHPCPRLSLTAAAALNMDHNNNIGLLLETGEQRVYKVCNYI